MARGARTDDRRRGDRSGAERTHPSGRVPPHDIEAEKAVLSALLLDNAAIHAVYTELKADDFYHPVHHQIYAAMLSLTQENQPVDLHTLANWLNIQKQLDAVGGPVFLAELSDYEATAANVVHHARIVRDKAVKRRLIATATEIVELGFDESDGAGRLLDQAESRIFEISTDQARESFRPLHAEMQRTFDYVDAIMGRGGELTGVPTGFKELNDKTGGLQRGDLIIIAARPSMGKTALALNIARNAAVLHDKKVAVFSLEMTAQSLVIRLLSAEAEVDQSKFRTGYVTSHEYKKLQDAAGRLSQANLWIDDSGVDHRARDARQVPAPQGREGPRPGAGRLSPARARRLAHRAPRAGDLRDQPRLEGARQGARHPGDRALAAEPRSREPAGQGQAPDAGRPARVRRDRAGRRSDRVHLPRRVLQPDDPNNQGLAELIISKQRNGPTGTINLNFEHRYAKFLDRSSGYDDAGGAPPGGAGFVPPEGGDFGAGSDVF